MAYHIIESQDYRDIIRTLCRTRKISQKDLAQATGIHSSYFSRVMTEGADFSGAQLYLVGTNLGLEKWQLDYFLLLGEYSATNNHAHRHYLQQKISEIQKTRSKVLSRMEEVESLLSEADISLYYREPVTAMIHMFLTIQKYRNNPGLICNKIFIPEFKLKIELEKLHSLGIISYKDESIEILKFNVHLDEGSPISAQNHINWRLQTINYLQKRTSRPSDYHLSAVFSTDEGSKLEIKKLFKEFVVEAQKIASGPRDQEDVFFISFDLY